MNAHNNRRTPMLNQWLLLSG